MNLLFAKCTQILYNPISFFIEFRRMEEYHKHKHSRWHSSLIHNLSSSMKNHFHPFRRTFLGKFSTSDLDQEVLQETQLKIEEHEQIVTQESSEQNTLLPKIEHPHIDSKLINTIFSLDKVSKSSTHRTCASKFQLPSKFNEKDKVLNDYVVSKLKALINKKRSEEDLRLSKTKLEQFYVSFMQSFSLTDLKRVFQSLESNRNISLCKQYILNQLHSYYSNRGNQKQSKKQNYQDILQIKLKSSMRMKHESAVFRAKENIVGLNLFKKEIKKISSTQLPTQRVLKTKKFENIVNEELKEQSHRLSKQLQIINRLQKSENNLKRSMCKKVDLLLSSGQYYENGFGELYNEFVEQGLDQRVFNSFLGPKEMQFLRQKSRIEKQISNLRWNGSMTKSFSKHKTKGELSKLQNELIVMQEDIINKLKNDRHVQKNVYSIFGNGNKGKSILERVRLNSPIKS